MGDGRRGMNLATIAAFGAVYLIWGSTYLAIRVGLESMPPLLMAGARFLVAGALLFGWARARGAARPSPGHWRGAAMAGILLLVIGNGGVTWAEQVVPSGLAALLVASEPIWLVLLSWAFYGAGRPGGRVWAGLALGAAGVGLLVLPGGGPTAVVEGTTTGTVVILVASAAWAFGSLSMRGASRPDSPSLATGMQMLVGGAILLGLGLLSGEARAFRPGAISLASSLALAYLVVFGSIVAFSAYVHLLRVATPARVSTYAYVNPVVAVLLGRVFAGEAVSPIGWVAMVVIVASVALVNAAESGPPRRAATADEALAGAARRPGPAACPDGP